MEQKNNRRSSRRLDLGSLMMRLALISFCLVLLSAHLMSGLFAKYSTTASGSDSARVAKFDVQVQGVDPNAINVTCTNYSGDTGSCTFTVTNKSEVAVEYDVVLAYSEASYLTPSFAEAGVQRTDPDTSTIRFSSDNWKLAPGTNSNTHTLAFTVDWDKFTSDATGSSKSVTVNYTITIVVRQVD